VEVKLKQQAYKKQKYFIPEGAALLPGFYLRSSNKIAPGRGWCRELFCVPAAAKNVAYLCDWHHCLHRFQMVQ